MSNLNYQIKYQNSTNFSKGIQENPEIFHQFNQVNSMENQEMFKKIMDEMQNESKIPTISYLNFDSNNSVFKPDINNNLDSNILNYNKIYLSSVGSTYTDRKLNKIVTISPNEIGLESFHEFTFQKYKWSLKTDKKIILNYNCQLAETISSENQKVQAWYTDEIEGSYGPEDYCGLNGIILELIINNGISKYSALEIKTFNHLHFEDK